MSPSPPPIPDPTPMLIPVGRLSAFMVVLSFRSWLTSSPLPCFVDDWPSPTFLRHVIGAKGRSARGVGPPRPAAHRTRRPSWTHRVTDRGRRSVAHWKERYRVDRDTRGRAAACRDTAR